MTGSRSVSLYRRSGGTTPRDPVDGETGLQHHLHETRTDSAIGKERPGDGVHDSCTLHRPGMVARSVSTYAQRQCGGRGWPNRGTVCVELGRQSSIAVGTRKGWHISSTTGAAGSHPERRWVANETHWHSNFRR